MIDCAPLNQILVTYPHFFWIYFPSSCHYAHDEQSLVTKGEAPKLIPVCGNADLCVRRVFGAYRVYSGGDSRAQLQVWKMNPP